MPDSFAIKLKPNRSVMHNLHESNAERKLQITTKPRRTSKIFENIFNKHLHLTSDWHRNLHRRLLAINWVYYELHRHRNSVNKNLFDMLEGRRRSKRIDRIHRRDAQTKWKIKPTAFEDFFLVFVNWATVRIKAKCHNSQINQSQVTTRDSRNSEHRSKSKRRRRPVVCVDDLTKMSKIKKKNKDKKHKR